MIRKWEKYYGVLQIITKQLPRISSSNKNQINKAGRNCWPFSHMNFPNVRWRTSNKTCSRSIKCWNSSPISVYPTPMRLGCPSMRRRSCNGSMIHWFAALLKINRSDIARVWSIFAWGLLLRILSSKWPNILSCSTISWMLMASGNFITKDRRDSLGKCRW